MISKITFKQHGCNDIEGYFDYVIQCRLNGNNIEALNLVKEMSDSQKLDFMEYISYMDEDETLQVLMYEVKDMIKK